MQPLYFSQIVNVIIQDVWVVILVIKMAIIYQDVAVIIIIIYKDKYNMDTVSMALGDCQYLIDAIIKTRNFQWWVSIYILFGEW